MGPAGHGAREKIERPYSNGSLFREIARRIWAPPPPPPFLFIRQHVGLTIYAVILMTVFSACASTTTPSSPSPGSPPAAWASGLVARRSTHQWHRGGLLHAKEDAFTGRCRSATRRNVDAHHHLRQAAPHPSSRASTGLGSSSRIILNESKVMLPTM
jgi:hypothetical protein